MIIHYVVYILLFYGDVIKDQAVLHPPDHLLLAQHAGGGHGDVLLEGQTVDISWSLVLITEADHRLESSSRLFVLFVFCFIFRD